MASLRLSLFGLPRIERDGVQVNFSRRKSLALLAYLALSPNPLSRDLLAELLWPERDGPTARTDLRTALFALRQALGPEWLAQEGDLVALQRGPGLWIDVEHFLRVVETTASHEHASGVPCDAVVAALTEAVGLYRGDFLAGFTLRDAPEFDNWQTYQTESLRLELAGALERLAWLEAAGGDYETAIRHGRSWLELDPLCEEPHRALMRLFAESGNRAAALRQYGECVRVLDEELGIKPDVETSTLRDAVAGGAVPAHPGVSLRQPPLELPPERTPFIGREAELAQVAARLADPACRLLTVLGPGGSGKTRLAVAAARGQAGQYRDGIYFVDLQPVESADLLAAVILRTLVVSASGAENAADQLIAHLRDRNMLLVLDNFEHLMDGVELLPRLLDAVPGLKLLITSRARLNLVEEWLLPLGGMALPPETMAHVALGDFSATALFLACANRLRPDYRPEPREAREIGSICRLLEGMPLGIELAAARMRTLPVGEIAAELACGLDVLATTMRDAPARHRSMAAAFDGSWQLLTATERSILRQASVFRGGFTSEAVGAVTGATQQELDALADSCWLRVEAGGRWGMHELIRQYCEAKLRTEHPAETGEGEAAVHDRHGRYYYSYLMAKQELLDTDESITSDVAPSFDNVVAAWEYWAASDDYEAVRSSLWFFVEMVDRLGWWGIGKPIIQQNIRWFEHAASAGLGDPAQRRLRDYALAALWTVCGWWEVMTGRRSEAGNCYDRAVAALGVGDPDDPAWAQVNLVLQQHRGIIAYLSGDFTRSTEIFLDLLCRLERATTQIWPYPANSRLHWQSWACLLIAHNATGLGRYADGRAWAERSVALAEAYASASGMTGGDRAVLVYPLMATGEYVEAERCARAGLRSAAGTNYNQQIAMRLCDLAHLYLVWGKPGQARVWGRRALAYCEDTGNIYSLHPALCGLANAELALDRVSEAHRFFRRSLSSCNPAGALPDTRYSVSALGLGQVALAEGKLETAVTWVRRALASTARSADVTTGAVLLRAEIERSQGKAERAAELLGFVARSPLAWHATRQKALAALRELESELPPDVHAAAVARGESRELADLVAELLAEGDHALS